MRKILVECKLFVEVEIPNDAEYDMQFDIEENHCPGTGIVGAAITKMIEECDEKSVCSACNFQGENKIIGLVADKVGPS